MSRFITCKSASMLLTLSSCPSNEHTSNSLSSLTLLTFINSCTYMVQSSAEMFRLSDRSNTRSIIAFARCVMRHRLGSRRLSSLSMMSETRFTCPSKTFSSESVQSSLIFFLDEIKDLYMSFLKILVVFLDLIL